MMLSRSNDDRYKVTLTGESPRITSVRACVSACVRACVRACAITCESSASRTLTVILTKCIFVKYERLNSRNFAENLHSIKSIHI